MVFKEPPKIATPSKYSGKGGKIEFRPWLRMVLEYLDYHRDSYTDEQNKICWVGAQMEGDEVAWYVKRLQFMERLQIRFPVTSQRRREKRASPMNLRSLRVPARVPRKEERLTEKPSHLRNDTSPKRKP